MNSEQQILLAKYQGYQTRHLLHLVLSIITAGFWIPIWIICGISNANERRKIEKKIREIG